MEENEVDNALQGSLKKELKAYFTQNIDSVADNYAGCDGDHAADMLVEFRQQLVNAYVIIEDVKFDLLFKYIERVFNELGESQYRMFIDVNAKQGTTDALGIKWLRTICSHIEWDLTYDMDDFIVPVEGELQA